MKTVCEITFVVQGDILSEGYKICMENVQIYLDNM